MEFKGATSFPQGWGFSFDQQLNRFGALTAVSDARSNHSNVPVPA